MGAPYRLRLFLGFSLQGRNMDGFTSDSSSSSSQGGLFNLVTVSVTHNLALTGPLTSVSGPAAVLLAAKVGYSTKSWVFELT
jgi:hypothetical protein